MPSPETTKQSATQKVKSQTPLLDAFGIDLTERARKGELDPVIGRDGEATRALEILCRRGKNNPIFIGEAGVGKTAVVEGLAQRIADGWVPYELKDTRIVTLDLPGLLAGTQYRGEFEERIKGVMEEVQNAKNIILFIDEIHMMLGAGSRRGGLDLANMLKPALSRGVIRLIGATTLDEYAKYFESDAALTRRFQPVFVDEPSVDDTFKILKGIAGKYEKHHKVTYSPEALHVAVTLSDRYLPDRKLPDKAIDVLDEAGALARMEAVSNTSGKKSETVAVSDDLIRRVVSMMSGTPVSFLSGAEAERLLNLKQRLNSVVLGQAEATDAVARAVLRSRAGLSDPNRPRGTFLFLGPSGVGKTLTAKVLARDLFGSEDAMITVDMSEFMDKANLSRLIGAPPGYIGYENGGQLTEQVRRRPYSVVLLDEIEKAHPDVLNALLQVLEEGRLTDGHGRVVDFSNTIIIMTSNAGVHDASNTGFGFGGRAGSVADRMEARKERVNAAVESIFRPEFLNRIDARVLYNSIDRETAARILDLELQERFKRVRETKGIEIEISNEARELLLEKGFSEIYNARPLRRVIDNLILDPLIEEILRGHMGRGDKVLVTCDGERLQFPVVTDIVIPKVEDAFASPQLV